MKTLKIFVAAVLMTVIAIITGCSDQITSNGLTDNSNSVDKTPGKHASSFEMYVRIKPFHTFRIDESNTSLSRFNSLRVVDPNPSAVDINNPGVCDDLLIFSESAKDDRIITCNETGLDVADLEIQNYSSKMIDLKVTVTGKLKEKLTK